MALANMGADHLGKGIKNATGISGAINRGDRRIANDLSSGCDQGTLDRRAADIESDDTCAWGEGTSWR